MDWLAWFTSGGICISAVCFNHTWSSSLYLNWWWWWWGSCEEVFTGCEKSLLGAVKRVTIPSIWFAFVNDFQEQHQIHHTARLELIKMNKKLYKYKTCVCVFVTSTELSDRNNNIPSPLVQCIIKRFHEEISRTPIALSSRHLQYVREGAS